jgi:hypothetical protein
LSSIATGSLAFYQGANSRDLQDILLPAKAGMLVLSLDLQHLHRRQFPILRLVIAASLFPKMRARRPHTVLLGPALRPPGRFANAIRKCKRQ